MPKYKAGDKMSDLISDDFNLLQVMCRFDIPLGFGDKSVKEVCDESGVDCYTFLEVVNFTADGIARMEEDAELISLPTLMKYLKSSHDYFINYSIPANRVKLEEALPQDDRVARLIMQFYDQYADEVRTHMTYEDLNIFTYVNELLEGKVNRQFTITTFSKQHNEAGDKLNDLKNIIIKYYPGKDNNTQVIDALFDIYKNEEWLAGHCKVEDNILVPAIMKLERRLTAHEGQ